MRFETGLWLPRPRDEVFAFFSDAANLEAITPPWVSIRILTPTPIAMRTGTLLDYRIRLHGIPMAWQSEITAWNPPCAFSDVQRRGPYRRWEHTHVFEAMNGGTRVHDWVEYEVPLTFLTSGFVRRDVEQIFAFRAAAMRRRFS